MRYTHISAQTIALEDIKLALDILNGLLRSLEIEFLEEHHVISESEVLYTRRLPPDLKPGQCRLQVAAPVKRPAISALAYPHFLS